MDNYVYTNPLLLPSSDFPDPSRDERRAYAVYWQAKLASNKGVEFPDDFLDVIASKTQGFSFAYLKEALFVSK